MDDHNKFIVLRKEVETHLNNFVLNYQDENRFKRDDFVNNFIPNQVLKNPDFSVKALR